MGRKRQKGGFIGGVIADAFSMAAGHAIKAGIRRKFKNQRGSGKKRFSQKGSGFKRRRKRQRGSGFTLLPGLGRAFSLGFG